MSEARELIFSSLGRMTREQLDRLLKLFNQDFRAGRPRVDRFSPAFIGDIARNIMTGLDALNRRIPSLWTSEGPALDRALEEFWKARDVHGAGRSLPTMILHARSPEQYLPLMSGLDRGYAALFGKRVGHSARAYREYLDDLTTLRLELGVSEHVVDCVLMDVVRLNRAIDDSASDEESDDDDDTVPVSTEQVAAVSRPDFADLLEQYSTDDTIRDAAHHNLSILKCVRGGLAMTRACRLSFDPRRSYWHPPERRAVVAYLSDRWHKRFAPPQSVRQYALRLFRHMRRLRDDGQLSFLGVDYERAGGWRGLCEQLMQHASRLGAVPEYENLRAIWPDLGQDAGEDFASFLAPTIDDPNGPAKLEGGSFKRLPWFPYLDAATLDDVETRQRFFYGYANLLTSTNAYRKAGAQAFAPLIGNTPTDLILDTIERWMAGEPPLKTGFPSLGKDDEQTEDRVHYATVLELYGFLHLEQVPFYNKQAEVYRSWMGQAFAEADAYELTRAVGADTHDWLNRHPHQIPIAAAKFRAAARSVPVDSPVVFESISSESKARKAGASAGDLVDAALKAELDRMATQDLLALSDKDAAATWLHLLLDSVVYQPTGETGLPPDIAPVVINSTQAPPVAVVPTPAEPAPVQAHGEAVLNLPSSLRPYGEQALGYLHAGLHVLLAGAPGTGKTTLAQFIAHAWNKGLPALADRMRLADAPPTTVANSAWSPFHTIGGLVPMAGGAFRPHAGIFISQESIRQPTWRLRDECIVLDEMNRADLDRCIGELYPLLSGSVHRVHPAGLPEVGAIEMSPRFRIVATVNDATLDDIVFPISDGLARRFQRIELLGASEEELAEYLGKRADNSQGARVNQAIEAVSDFFRVAGESDLLSQDDEMERLRFGVGYFVLLQAWAQDRLRPGAVASEEPKRAARKFLAESLTGLMRNQKLNAAIRKYRDQP